MPQYLHIIQHVAISRNEGHRMERKTSGKSNRNRLACQHNGIALYCKKSHIGLEKQMNIVILDAYSVNPGDISWDPIRAFGNLTVYDHTPPEQIASESARRTLSSPTARGWGKRSFQERNACAFFASLRQDMTKSISRRQEDTALPFATRRGIRPIPWRSTLLR